MLATKEQRAEDRSRRVGGCDGGIGKRGAREDRLRTGGRKGLGSGRETDVAEEFRGDQAQPCWLKGWALLLWCLGWLLLLILGDSRAAVSPVKRWPHPCTANEGRRLPGGEPPDLHLCLPR